MSLWLINNIPDSNYKVSFSSGDSDTIDIPDPIFIEYMGCKNTTYIQSKIDLPSLDYSDVSSYNYTITQLDNKIVGRGYMSSYNGYDNFGIIIGDKNALSAGDKNAPSIVTFSPDPQNCPSGANTNIVFMNPYLSQSLQVDLTQYLQVDLLDSSKNIIKGQSKIIERLTNPYTFKDVPIQTTKFIKVTQKNNGSSLIYS